MSRRKGELSSTIINRDFPFQVAVARGGLLSPHPQGTCNRMYEVRHFEGTDFFDFIVYCFNDKDIADGFRRRMGGQWCSPEERRLKRWKASEALLLVARQCRKNDSLR